MKKGIYTQDQIDAMRKRLYDRGQEVEKLVRHELSEDKVDVSNDWSSGAQKPVVAETTSDLVVADLSIDAPVKKKRHYRSFVLIGSLLIFIFLAGLSALYWMYGGNQISNDNIQIAIQGKALVGGGEEMSLQVAVTNQNNVPIEAATLIIKYPPGTRSVGDSPRNLFEERIPLNDIGPGEVQNVPVKVVVYGEENNQKIINATVEYRINGSNGTFYKEAKPLEFRISSSPLVLRVESIEKVASGQLVDVVLTAVSNASTPIQNVLVTASYPNGFSFQSSEPAPVYGQNVWEIPELLPEQSATIKLKGIVSGLTEEVFRINFEAGPSNPDNRYLVGSILTNTYTEFLIERPFIDVQIAINGDKDREVVIPEGVVSNVSIDIINTLDETVYDMVVEVVPGGNALDERSISSESGFYDSNTGTVRWEVSNNESFEQVLPGGKRNLEFTVKPGVNRTTSAFDMVVNVYARRVAESSALETLIGTIRAEAKYSASILLGSQASLSSGPVPPKVGETTTYTLTLVAEAGANDMTGTIVETSLPVHVDWLDTYEAEGKVTYNSVSKKLQWEVGNLSSGERKEIKLQISFKPSISQVGRTPVIINNQTVRANDRFTGALLQDDAPAVTTELSTEMGYGKDNGVVVQ